MNSIEWRDGKIELRILSSLHIMFSHFPHPWAHEMKREKKLRRLNCVNFTKTLFDFNPHRDATAEEVYGTQTHSWECEENHSSERVKENQRKLNFMCLLKCFLVSLTLSAVHFALCTCQKEVKVITTNSFRVHSYHRRYLSSPTKLMSRDWS